MQTLDWGRLAARLGWRSAAAEKKFSRDQPRVPAGNPDGGQWASTGASSEVRRIEDGPSNITLYSSGEVRITSGGFIQDATPGEIKRAAELLGMDISRELDFSSGDNTPRSILRARNKPQQTATGEAAGYTQGPHGEHVYSDGKRSVRYIGEPPHEMSLEAFLERYHPRKADRWLGKLNYDLVIGVARRA